MRHSERSRGIYAFAITVAVKSVRRSFDSGLAPSAQDDGLFGGALHAQDDGLFGGALHAQDDALLRVRCLLGMTRF